MAQTFSSNLSLFLNPSSFIKAQRKETSISRSFHPVRCGPRDNRGPLVKGRILSTEAIQAIQSLKRASARQPEGGGNLPSLTRLLKSDLLAALRELLRQDQCTLALYVLSTLRLEYPPVDINLYAEIVNGLARNGELGEIDRLVQELDGIDGGDDKGLAKLLRGVISAGRRESTVEIYKKMESNGWGSAAWEADEYVVEVLSKGLRQFGEKGLAEEVEMKFIGIPRANLGKRN